MTLLNTIKLQSFLLFSPAININLTAPSCITYLKFWNVYVQSAVHVSSFRLNIIIKDFHDDGNHICSKLNVWIVNYSDVFKDYILGDEKKTIN